MTTLAGYRTGLYAGICFFTMAFLTLVHDLLGFELSLAFKLLDYAGRLRKEAVAYITVFD
jgi:hypothetical protein